MNRTTGLFLLCLLLFFGEQASFSQTDSLRVMSWNVENLFDTHHDSLKLDYDFLPDGDCGWTPVRYWQKLRDVARVVMSAGNDDRVPDLVGLCEVENDTVMFDLTRRSALRSCGYQYVMTDSPDARGVDVALLYLPIRFRLLGHELRSVPSVEHGLPPTRDILHCWGRTPAADTLHVVVCHLPSKGGGLAGQRNRELAVQTLVSLVDSLGPTCRLMVMGDFNADPFDRLFRRLPTLTDLAPRHRYPAVGSYFFRGRWSWIDHILLSASLSHGALRSVSAPWWQDGTATGSWKPRRTYLGKGYHGGVSDHLPVVVSLPL